MNRRRYLGLLVAGLTGCQTTGNNSTESPSPSSKTLTRTNPPTSSLSAHSGVGAITVDPDDSFETVALSPSDEVKDRIENGPQGTRYKFNPGTYEIDATHIPSRTILEGTGPEQTILRQHPDANHVHFLRTDGNSRVEIRGMKVDVNAQSQPERHNEGERGIQFANGELGIVRDVEIINASGHSVKWFNWDGGIAHRVSSHSPSKTAPRPDGRGAIQAGAHQKTTRNILIHDCTTLLPAGNISHRGTTTEGIVITGSRLIDIGDEPEEWVGVNLHKTTGGLVAGNTFIRTSEVTRYLRCTADTADIAIVGNRFTGVVPAKLDEAMFFGESTTDIRLQKNALGGGGMPPTIINDVIVSDDLVQNSPLQFQLIQQADDAFVVRVEG